jgi:hypothetical protein
MIQRETLKDGSVRLRSPKCSFTYYRLRPGVVLMRIEGDDGGEFGTATMDELREDLSRYAPVEFFVEMLPTAGAKVTVQEAWTEWFSQNRSALKSVSMLTRSKYMHFTAEVVKLFSRTGELIRVYLEEQPFEEAIARAVPGFARLADLHRE